MTNYNILLQNLQCFIIIIKHLPLDESSFVWCFLFLLQLGSLMHNLVTWVRISSDFGLLLACTAISCESRNYQTHKGLSYAYTLYCSLLVKRERSGALMGTRRECTSLTLPTSTSLVIMTMLKQFSCHTILQKSYKVSCLGPDGKKEKIKEKEIKKETAASRSVLSKKGVFLLWWSVTLLFTSTVQVNNLIGISTKGRKWGDRWQNNSGGWKWKPRGPQPPVNLCPHTEDTAQL